MSANKHHLRAGVFIDGSNTFWALRNADPEDRWNLDFGKFKKHLQDKYRPIFYNYYGTTDDSPTSEKYERHAIKEKKFHAVLSGKGYSVITKPLKYIRDRATGRITTKGDMDVEMTMGINNALEDIDLVVLVSGDSDYLEVIKQLHAKGKYVRIYAFKHSLAWEIKEFAIKNTRCSYKYIEDLRADLEYNGEA